MFGIVSFLSLGFWILILDFKFWNFGHWNFEFGVLGFGFGFWSLRFESLEFVISGLEASVSDLEIWRV